MNLKGLTLYVSAALLLLTGCGGGDRVVETRSVAPFDRIVVSGGLDVEVAAGPPAVRVHAGEDVIDRVTTQSSGGVLALDLGERGIVIGPDPLGDARVMVTVPTLAGLEIDGAGDVDITGLDQDALEIEVHGAGDVTAAGTVERLTAEVRGAADADLSELEARRAQVSIHGAGDVDLDVSERLNVTVRGAADVNYTGDPDVTSDIQGAGDVRQVRP